MAANASTDEGDDKIGNSRLPSVAWLALFVLPLLFWSATVISGCLLFTSEPKDHFMADFDRYVFRRYGALLPFLPLLIRFSIYHEDHQASISCLMAYISITATRALLYWLHLKFQGLNDGALMSDHILLASSIVATLHSEIIHGMDGLFKMELRCAGLLQESIAAMAFVLSILLFGLISLDAHFTCRYYHHPTESLLAVFLGALFFQAPLLHWIRIKLLRSKFRVRDSH